MNDLFLDVEIQGMQEMDENSAFCRFIDKYSNRDRKVIFIADRGYGSLNNYAHALHNNQFFLIRMRESSAKSLCPDSPYLLNSACVDENITIHVGRRRLKSNRKYENYHYVKPHNRYDFIACSTDSVDSLSFRVLKFPLSSGKSEYIATNLPIKTFPLKVIKTLYNMRWGEETAFRHLKYAGNMVHIHSIKPDFLIQEVYGKLTMYNFSSCITKAIAQKETRNTAYTYSLNHTQIQKFTRLYLLKKVKKLEILVNRFLVPVRPGRKFKRIIRRQSAEPLTYR
jgi:hypothetical protein